MFIDTEETKKGEEGDDDDKMWQDVDKDLGELLREVGTENGNPDEEDEEDSRLNAERFV